MQLEQTDLLQALYEEHEKVLRFVALKRSIPSVDVSDVVQETFCSFINAYKKKANEWDEAQIKAVLMKILNNECTDYFRKSLRHPNVSMEALIETGGEALIRRELLPDIQASIERQEELVRIREAIKALTPEMQKVAILCLVEERPVSEVSEMLKISESTCRMRICRIRKYLRNCIEQPETAAPKKRGRPRGSRNKILLVGEPETG